MINKLSILINSLQKDTHQVILSIDANEYILSNKGGIIILLEKTKIIDPIANMHGEIYEPKTFRQEYTLYFVQWMYQYLV